MHVIADSTELRTIAVTMGTSAMELADVGSSLRSCTDCAMPPETRTMVDQLVAVSDKVLDSSASVLRSEAADLSRRALIAANDSLAAASLATIPAPVSIIGGNSSAPFIIASADGSFAGFPPATTLGGTPLEQAEVYRGGTAGITLVKPDGTRSMTADQLKEQLDRPVLPMPAAIAANRSAIDSAIDQHNQTLLIPQLLDQNYFIQNNIERNIAGQRSLETWEWNDGRR